jgi:hypothetical protein
MTSRELVAVKILLMVAKWFAPTEWTRDIEQLAAHITVDSWNTKKAA